MREDRKMCGYHLRCRNSGYKCQECKEYNLNSAVSYLDDRLLRRADEKKETDQEAGSSGSREP